MEDHQSSIPNQDVFRYPSYIIIIVTHSETRTPLHSNGVCSRQIQCEQLGVILWARGQLYLLYKLSFNIPHTQIQELSNKAAVRFDKANSQHTAAKEMIQMSESQLSNRSREGPDPSSPSPIDLAWQEMLNHATIKVRHTYTNTFVTVFLL